MKMIKYDSRGKIKNFNNFQAIVQNHYHRPSCHDKSKVSNERPARNPFPLARIEPETRMEGYCGTPRRCDVFIARGGVTRSKAEIPGTASPNELPTPFAVCNTVAHHAGITFARSVHLPLEWRESSSVLDFAPRRTITSLSRSLFRNEISVKCSSPFSKEEEEAIPRKGRKRKYKYK